MDLFQLTTILVLGLGSAAPGAIEAYDQTLTLQGVTFRVQCDNAASENALTVAPSGLEIATPRSGPKLTGLSRALRSPI